MRSSRGLGAAVLAVVFVAGCATGSGGPEEGGPPRSPGRAGRGAGPGQPRQAGSWTAYDLNGDGKVSRAEFAAARNACFLGYDANDDGVLSLSEVRRRLPPQQAERLDATFARIDRDRDGQITREEFDRESETLFRFLDANGDGVIAGMEIINLNSALMGDLCQPSRSPEAGEG